MQAAIDTVSAMTVLVYSPEIGRLTKRLASRSGW